MDNADEERIDNETVDQDLEDLQDEPDELTSEFVERLIDKILQFMVILVGHDLHSYQKPFARRIIQSVLVNDGDELTALASRQSGKSEVIANVMSTLMVILPRLAVIYPDLLGKFKDGVWIGMFAPVETQVETLYGRTVSRLTSEQALQVLGDPEIDDITARTPGVTKGIKLKKSGSTLLMMTANPRAKIESKSFHIIVIDECQDADDFVVSKCYEESTLMWLPDGSQRTIREVVEERLPVLTYDKEWDTRDRKGGQPRTGNGVDADPGRLVGALPTEFHDNGEQPVWRVTTATGRFLEVTENHQWVARRRVGNRRPRIYETCELTVGMQVPLPASVAFFGERGSEQSGYFLGQMLGDGCMTQSVQWCGYEGDPLNTMRQFAARFGTEFHVSRVSSDGFMNGAFTKPGNGVNHLKEFLKEEGVWGHKGSDKHIHYQDYSRAASAGLLSGLIDSDGHVSAKDISFSNISEKLVRQVSDLALKFGAVGYIHSRTNTRFSGSEDNLLWTVRFKNAAAIRALAEVLDLRDETKRARLASLSAASQSKTNRRSPSKTRRGALGDVQWDRITSIEPVGVRKTYCVTVEPSHLVVANGLICRQSISPMGAYYNATIIKTGTPTVAKNNFYKAIQLNKRLQTGRRGKQNHFQWDWKEVAKVVPNYKKFIKKEMLRIGEDSDEFILSYCCTWLLDRGMFITQNALEELGDKSMEIVKNHHRTPVIVGIDPARKTDSTVVTVVWVDWDRPDEFGYYDHRILNWLELQGEDWEEQYYQITSFLSNYDVLAVAIDGNGVGDAVAQRLKLLLPNTEVISLTSSQGEQSLRFKHLQALIQRKMLGWPAHAKTRRLRVYKRFIQQMSDAEVNYKGANFIVAAPDEAHAHDDYVDSLAMACSVTRELVMPTLEVSASPFYSR